MVGKASEVLNSIESLLKEKPLLFSEIVETVDIDRRTVERYLQLLEQWGIIIEKNIENKKMFFLKEENNYFQLPIKQKHQNLISTIYNKIKLFCKEIYFKEPTKTQVYKIIYLVNQKFNLDLPIGWYLYGPCCVQVYQGDEDVRSPLKKDVLNYIKEITEKYCKYDNIELQRIIYKQEDNELYQIKEKLISLDCPSDKKNINSILMELIRLVPEEAVEITTNFARVTLSRGWNDKTKDCFRLLWKYLSTIKFKQTLKYDDLYFEYQINSLKKETQLELLNIFDSK